MPNFAADEVVTAAKMNEIAKGVLGHAEVTASQTGVSAVADLTGLAVTVDVSSSARRIMITCNLNCRQVTSTGVHVVTAWEGSTQLGRLGTAVGAVATFWWHCSGHIILTPTGGSHTYKLRMQTSVGTCDIIADTGSSFGPNSITVVDLGAV